MKYDFQLDTYLKSSGEIYDLPTCLICTYVCKIVASYVYN